jgi:rhamnose transport system permease protein
MSNQPASNQPAVAKRAPFRWSSLLLRWELILLPLLALVMFMNGRASVFFWDPYNLGDATFNFSEKGIMAIAMALLILTREIDLSVSSIIALCSLVMGLAAERGAETPVLIFLAVFTGALAGFFNGFLVIRFAVPSIAITLGTMSLFRGISQAILGDQALTKYPESLATLGQGYLIEPIPISFATFLVLAVLVGLVLHRSRWGRQLYAIGSNPEAAKFSGVAVARYRLLLFTLSGTFAGLAAAFLTSRIASTRPNIAQGWELDVITMVVLGGIGIAGGTGSMLGVVLAVLLLGMISFGLALLNVPGIVASIFIGTLLIGAIALPPLLKKLMRIAGSKK